MAVRHRLPPVDAVVRRLGQWLYGSLGAGAIPRIVTAPRIGTALRIGTARPGKLCYAETKDRRQQILA
ncbi:MAG: hypothetical protein IIC13_03940 [SAR324 cluster bacterium]|nr:hypothetical protein [SAR324 cluster bacterium]